MKRIKLSLLKKYNGVISVLLTLLGFTTACEQGVDEYGTPAVEYGVPVATFIVKGTVKSETIDNPISNIRVVLNYDTVYTDNEGNYEVKNSDFPEDQSYTLEFKDIDGATNGNYQSLDTIVDFIDPQFTGDEDNWNVGEVEKEVNIKLKSKE